jgi:hypothetical protein
MLAARPLITLLRAGVVIVVLAIIGRDDGS